MQPDVVYDADFLSEKESEEVYSWIMDNVQWTQVQYNKYNKIIISFFIVFLNVEFICMVVWNWTVVVM